MTGNLSKSAGALSEWTQQRTKFIQVGHEISIWEMTMFDRIGCHKKGTIDYPVQVALAEQELSRSKLDCFHNASMRELKQRIKYPKFLSVLPCVDLGTLALRNNWVIQKSRT